MNVNNDLFAAEKLNIGLCQKTEIALIRCISGTSRDPTPSPCALASSLVLKTTAGIPLATMCKPVAGAAFFPLISAQKNSIRPLRQTSASKAKKRGSDGIADMFMKPVR